MGTQPIPQVTVNVTSVTAKDIEENDRKVKKTEAITKGVVDTLTVESTGLGTAGPAEGPSPTKKVQTKHESLKTASAELKKAFLAAGGQVGKDGTISEEAVEALVTRLDEEIANSDDPKEQDRLELKKENLKKAARNLLAVQAAPDASQPTTIKTESASTANNGSPQGGQNAALWDNLQSVLKSLGIDVGDLSDHDIERVRATVTEKFGKELSGVQAKIKSLTEEGTAIHTKLKTATSPEKEALQNQLKTITDQLNQLNQRKQQLITGFPKFSAVADQILAHQVSVDLGGETHHEKTVMKSEKKTAPAPQAKKTGGGTTGTVGTESVSMGTGGTGATGAGSPLLGTQSATGQQGDSYVGAGAGNTEPSTGGTLTTESVPTGGTSTESPAGLVTSNSVPLLAANDYTGTTLAIQSTSNQMKSDAKKTDGLIKKLLRAAMAGNWEAVKTALILLDKRASQITIGMGATTVKAMQYYEKQMAALNASLGKLDAQSADYNSKLAQINSQMNTYNMNRQAISNFLRDTMNMQEEIMSATKSVLDADRATTQKIT